MGEDNITRDTWPEADQQLRAHHLAMLERDPIATAQFAELALPLLILDMRIRHRGVSEEDIFDACAEAVLTICRVPDRWQPSRASLRTFLWMAATGDLRNAIDRRKGQVARERSMDPVELSELRRNIPAEAEIFEDEQSPLIDRCSHLLADDTDREIFKLMAEGERDETRFSVALGISQLSTHERKQRVKKAKDRIKKQLHRANIVWPLE